MSIQVSVIISNYFKAEYIKEAIDSVLNQSFRNFEIIVVDDTNGREAIEKLPAPHRIYKTDDIGLSALRMFGVGKSNGKHVLFLDADDKIHPDFLKRTVETLEANPQFSFCYTDTQHFDGADSFWVQPDYNFHALLQGNYICSCSLIRRNDLIACGGFDLDNFNYWEDYEFWIAMGAKGYYGIHIPEKLFLYRINPKSGMQSDRNAVLSSLYKAYIVTKFPYLYPENYVAYSTNIVNKFPKGFMALKPYQQEEFIKNNPELVRHG